MTLTTEELQRLVDGFKGDPGLVIYLARRVLAAEKMADALRIAGEELSKFMAYEYGETGILPTIDEHFAGYDVPQVIDSAISSYEATK